MSGGSLQTGSDVHGLRTRAARRGRLRPAFTLIELLVVVAIIALLCAVLLPSMARAREQARNVICRSNLNEWGKVFTMYVQANRDSFTDGRVLGSGGGWDRGEWIIALRSFYYTRMNILRCPLAMKRRPYKENHGGSFHTYYMPLGGNGSRGGGEEPRYGLNNWLYNPPASVTAIQGRPTINNWRRSIRARYPHRVPVFADTMWRGGGPSDSGSRGAPPAFDSEWTNADAEMRHFCINRHGGYNNHLFLDSSVRRVGLKELWTLKWHRNFNTGGLWTRAGGRKATDWPAWMRRFPDY